MRRSSRSGRTPRRAVCSSSKASIPKESRLSHSPPASRSESGFPGIESNPPHDPGARIPMTRDPKVASAATSAAALREVALLFSRLGSTVFGGPAAHIARMHEEVVTRRHWLTSKDFFDLLASTNFIPGPNSTEMAIHIGYRRAGAKGLVVAGVCFILPAAILTLILAWAYVRFGSLPA